MRIGYLTYGLDRSPTGIGRYSVELLRALAHQPGCPEIVLLTTEREDKHGLWNQFEHYALPGCRKLPGLLTLGNLELSLATQRLGLNLIHDPNGIAPFWGPAAQAKRVITIHDTFSYIYPETHNVVDKWRYRWMLPFILKKADTVLTVSQCSSRDIQQYLRLSSKKIKVIVEGVGSQFKPVRNAAILRSAFEKYGLKPPYLLYVGGINARKNIARLLEAFARLLEYYPGITLVINGKRQWQLTKIDATFQRLNLQQHVHFTGYVDDEDLPALYSGAEVFVFPSLYEGFGLPPLEAMACGTPVITSNTSSLPEVVGDAAITIDPFDMVALSEAMKKVLTDAGLHTLLQQRGLEQAAKFTWQRVAQETIEAYHQTIGDGVP